MNKHSDTSEKAPKIVIVGGGAGGMELAALLGKKMGKKHQTHITLIDASPTHLWKPLLHEVAAGTLNSHEDEINYMAYASHHYFNFILGKMQGLNRETKEILLAPVIENNHTLIPERKIPYDILIIAVGSVANDFGIMGVRENCLFLDNRFQADYFHQYLLKNLMAMPYHEKTPFTIGIVGGGATGIELIAELHNAVRLMASYGLAINPEQIHFILIEAADRLLPVLPERLSKMVFNELERLKVDIFLNEQVTEVTPEFFMTKSGKKIPANIKVWTAGIKSPDFLKNLDGLEVNKANQLMVKPTLQTTLDESIFAFGDCASCPQKTMDKPVPPRAQAAHQQAIFLVKALKAYLHKKPLPEYIYHDYGSLISLSHYQVIGNLMGKITKSWMVEGKLARLFYLSLYKQHQAALYGLWRVSLLTMANLLSSRVRPRLKLH